MTRDFEVVIPAFNAAATVGTAVTSGLESGASRVVVVDDGSDDQTCQVAEMAGATVVVVENGGAAKARRIGLTYVSATYVVFLDADDELVPDGLESLFIAVSNSPSSVGGIGAYVAVNDANGTSKRISPWPNGVDLTGALKRGYAPGPPGAMLLRAASVRAAAKADPPALEPRYAEDYETLVRLLTQGPLTVVEDVTCIYSEGLGKSARAPMEVLLSVEATRQYYASAMGHDIRRRSSADMEALVMRRQALVLRRSSPLKGLRLSVRSFIRSPGIYAHHLVEAIRRRMS